MTPAFIMRGFVVSFGVFLAFTVSVLFGKKNESYSCEDQDPWYCTLMDKGFAVLLVASGMLLVFLGLFGDVR